MILKLRNIEKSFGEKRVVTGVAFRAEGGKAFGLLGRNGAGKTTLMRVLTTIIKPVSGQIMFENIPYKEKNYEAIQKRIGYLPQVLNLYPNLTPKETLMYLGQMAGVEKSYVLK